MNNIQHRDSLQRSLLPLREIKLVFQKFLIPVALFFFFLIRSTLQQETFLDYIHIFLYSMRRELLHRITLINVRIFSQFFEWFKIPKIFMSLQNPDCLLDKTNFLQYISGYCDFLKKMFTLKEQEIEIRIDWNWSERSEWVGTLRTFL